MLCTAAETLTWVWALSPCYRSSDCTIHQWCTKIKDWQIWIIVVWCFEYIPADLSMLRNIVQSNWKTSIPNVIYLVPGKQAFLMWYIWFQKILRNIHTRCILLWHWYLLFGPWPEFLPSFSKTCYRLQKNSARN